MSYNLSVNVVRECEVYCAQSVTGNLDDIFIRAIGQDGLRGLDGELLADVEGQLLRAYRHISDPSNLNEYMALGPSNGWGSYLGAMQIIRELLESYTENPNGVIRIS